MTDLCLDAYTCAGDKISGKELRRLLLEEAINLLGADFLDGFSGSPKRLPASELKKVDLFS